MHSSSALPCAQEEVSVKTRKLKKLFEKYQGRKDELSGLQVCPICPPHPAAHVSSTLPCKQPFMLLLFCPCLSVNTVDLCAINLPTQLDSGG